MAASPTHFSTSHRVGLQNPSWPTRPSKFPKNENPRKNLYFLSAPTPNSLSNPLLCSSPFPLVPKPPQVPIPFHPLHDTAYDYLLEEHPAARSLIEFDVPTGRGQPIVPANLFLQDPPCVSPLCLRGVYKGLKLDFRYVEKRKYNLLRRRQVKEETEVWDRMLDEYRGWVKEMRDKKLAPNLSSVKGLFLGWFEPLNEAIEREKELQRSKHNGHKTALAPYIDLLSSDKMALIVMHTVLTLITKEQECGYVPVVQAAVKIGMAIEQEVSVLAEVLRHLVSRMWRRGS